MAVELREQTALVAAAEVVEMALEAAVRDSAKAVGGSGGESWVPGVHEHTAGGGLIDWDAVNASWPTEWDDTEKIEFFVLEECAWGVECTRGTKADMERRAAASKKVGEHEEAGEECEVVKEEGLQARTPRREPREELASPAASPVDEPHDGGLVEGADGGRTLDFESVSPVWLQVALQVKGLEESVKRAVRSLHGLQELETAGRMPRAELQQEGGLEAGDAVPRAGQQLEGGLEAGGTTPCAGQQLEGRLEAGGTTPRVVTNTSLWMKATTKGDGEDMEELRETGEIRVATEKGGERAERGGEVKEGVGSGAVRKESKFQAKAESARRVGEYRDCDSFGPSRWSSDASTTG